jgi:uroporphyrinogen-III decarboxylase
MYALNRLTGSEVFALWSIDERAMLDELIGILLERTLDYVGWLISQGVGQALGYVGPELCIPPLQSPADFERWVVGPDRQIADLIHDAGGLMLVHCHGGLDPILEGFVRMGADALHPIEPPAPDGSGLQGGVTMADAKRRVGEDLCIIGNIQHHEIEVGDRARRDGGRGLHPLADRHAGRLADDDGPRARELAGDAGRRA